MDPLEFLWEFLGSSFGVPWEFLGSSLGVHGSSLGVPWEFLWISFEVPLEFHESSLNSL